MDADGLLARITVLGIVVAGLGALTVLAQALGDVGAVVTTALLAVAVVAGVAVGRRGRDETTYW